MRHDLEVRNPLSGGITRATRGRGVPGLVLKPHIHRLRSAGLCRAWAAVASLTPSREPVLSRDPTFVIGCGRSGTTALGKALSRHPAIAYLNEPDQMWFAISRRTDYANRFGGEGDCYLDAGHCDDEVRRRARFLFGLVGLLSAGRLVVEKTPMNALRLAWLDAMFPAARYIHIVRHPAEVVASIRRISFETSGIAGLPYCNKWWGVFCHKWYALVEAPPCETLVGFNPKHAIQTGDPFTTMAALEWLLSVEAVEHWKATGASARMVEVRFEDLVVRPEEELHRLCEWAGAGPPPPACVARLVKPASARADLAHLPPALLGRIRAHSARLEYTL